MFCFFYVHRHCLLHCKLLWLMFNLCLEAAAQKRLMFTLARRNRRSLARRERKDRTLSICYLNSSQIFLIILCLHDVTSRKAHPSEAIFTIGKVLGSNMDWLNIDWCSRLQTSTFHRLHASVIRSWITSSAEIALTCAHATWRVLTNWSTRASSFTSICPPPSQVCFCHGQLHIWVIMRRGIISAAHRLPTDYGKKKKHTAQSQT